MKVNHGVDAPAPTGDSEVARSFAGEPIFTRRSRAASPPNYLVLAAERMGFSARPSFEAEFTALGSTAEERLNNYIDQQLYPGAPPGGIPPVDDSYVDSLIASSGYSTINKTQGQLWLDHVRGNQHRYDPMYDIELLTFTRAVYSKKQLFEVLTHFWHDHFNAYGRTYWSAPVWPEYNRIIRSNMLGNFRIFLGQIARHSAMLYFLDNYTSSAAGPNENFSRELFELHTLGAENYLGVLPQNQVPIGPYGKPIGYVDEDVFECTRCLTGWTVANGDNDSPDTGAFFYDDESHDRFQKFVLGTHIASNGGKTDGETVLNLVAYHPGTAVHIARKLCKKFISDNPPESIVQQAAQVFYANATKHDQLKQVVRTILRSEEFKSTWGEKTKRPFEIVVGAMRSTAMTFEFKDNADDVSSFFWRFGDTGHELFAWRSPDGYPDTRKKWESTTPRVLTWRLINWLADIHLPSPNDDTPRMNVASQTPIGSRTSNTIVDFWVNRILHRPIDPVDRANLVNFMAQGINPDLGLNLNDSSTESRLRSLVALILNSPYFLEK